MKSLSIFALSMFAAPALFAATTYQVQITNGSNMPISPSVVYVKNGSTALSSFGQKAQPAFVKLCQMGDAAARSAEVAKVSGVTSVERTANVLMPGQSAMVEIAVNNPSMQSIQVEAMYGKSVDTCAITSINSHSLVALKQHVSPEFNAIDIPVETGAFMSARIDQNSLDNLTYVCSSAANSIGCLRELGTKLPAAGTIKAHTALLPSLVSLLETKFGADDAESVLVPAQGGVLVSVKLKH